MKILVTGGHHTSALAVIDSLKSKDPSIEFIWVGHTHSMYKDTNLSAEYKEISSLNIPFFDIDAGKFYKIYNPLRLFKILTGFLNAFRLLQRERPDGILSFGGYIAVPVVICGAIFGIPSVTHEQTVVAGIANRVISKFVKRIFISWKESQRFYPPEKTVLTGLPIRKEIFMKQSSDFEFANNLPVTYVTGGKQGSHLLNEVVKDSLPKLLVFTNVIHQCGSSSLFNDFVSLSSFAASLPDDIKNRYKVVEYVNTSQIGEVFKRASLVISRSGAHTAYELLALRKPSILVPIPWVSHNEQEENAKILLKEGIAIVLHEKDLTPGIIIESVLNMLNNKEKYIGLGLNRDLIMSNSAELIANETISTFKTSKID